MTAINSTVTISSSEEVAIAAAMAASNSLPIRIQY